MSIVKGNCFVNLVISLLLKKRLWNVLALHWRRHGVALLIIILKMVCWLLPPSWGKYLKSIIWRTVHRWYESGRITNRSSKFHKDMVFLSVSWVLAIYKWLTKPFIRFSTDVPLKDCHSSPGVKKLMADNIFMSLV